MKTKLKTEKIIKDMTFEELISKYPQTISLLLEKGMHCAGCHAASTETIEQGAIAYGINPDEFVKELNLFAGEKEE